MIVTSRSAVATYQSCPRKRYWQYEAENSTPTRGWERRKLNIPYSTGIYVHQGLEHLLGGNDATTAAAKARAAYLAEVEARSLVVEEGSDVTEVVSEQAAHVEALVLAWARVRKPKWDEEYELVEVEIEDRVPLSDDVTLAVRADAIVRRKYDHRMFVVNFKTVATADERWMRQWETDMQLMTELLAAERRHGHEFGGVIIEGLIKGRRMPEKDNVGTITGYRDSTPLLYGYKLDANPPLNAGEYGWEYTRRKGWYRFPVWKENFSSGQGLNYWINWLPEEVVEAQFCVVPPIMRDAERIESKVRQIVEMERTIHRNLSYLGKERTLRLGDGTNLHNVMTLDECFPQNEQECHWPSKCPCYDLCFTANVAQDPGGSGLYQPRIDHHKEPSDGGA